MKLKHLLVSAVTAILLGSCTTPQNISYFQDLKPGESELTISEPVELRIRAKDKLSIIVNSQDPRLTNMFNLPIISQQIGTGSTSSVSGSTSGTSRGVSGYTVKNNGCIDFPVLGELKVEGMTREEIATYIKKELVAQDLVKDPVVTVEFMNLAIAILGEVNNPGRYNIDRDHLTVLDAISDAGDLTIYGKRENVMVLRQVDGKQRVYNINLNSAEQVYSSPVYYLQQGDVVYVDPNDTRKRQGTINGNTLHSTAFWISIASLLTTIVNLIIN